MQEFNNKDVNLLILLSEIATIEQLARSKLDNALPRDLNISSFSVLNHFIRSKTEGTWIWTQTGQQFWQGDDNGTPVNDLFTNWANNEPNDSLG